MKTTISFSYDISQDEKCWKRYKNFISTNGSVWGMKKNIKQIVTVKSAFFDIDISEIIDAYSPIFNIQQPSIYGYLVTTPFSMINDDEKYSSDSSVIYYSIFTQNPSVVLAHEIFHIYFEKFTSRDIPNYDEAKEYFTVIINDIFSGNVSGGYPEHQEMRRKVYETWLKTKSITSCINLLNE